MKRSTDQANNKRLLHLSYTILSIIRSEGLEALITLKLLGTTTRKFTLPAK